MEPIKEEVRQGLLAANPDLTPEDIQLYEHLRIESLSPHADPQHRQILRASQVKAQLAALHAKLFPTASRPSPSSTSHRFPHLLTLSALGFALVGVVIFGIWLNKWNTLAFAIKPQDLASLLGPLALASAFVERAVEILISPWRDAGANKLEKVVSVAKARQADPTSSAENAVDLKASSDRLDEYRGQTQQIAFAVSLAVSMFVSISGIRGLGPFVDTAKFQTIPHAQQVLFGCVDVALSALLLAGGADGVHSVLNAVTTFFDSSANRNKQ